MKLLLVRSSHVTENSPSSINRFVNGDYDYVEFGVFAAKN